MSGTTTNAQHAIKLTINGHRPLDSMVRALDACLAIGMEGSIQVRQPDPMQRTLEVVFYRETEEDLSTAEDMDLDDDSTPEQKLMTVLASDLQQCSTLAGARLDKLCDALENHQGSVSFNTAVPA